LDSPISIDCPQVKNRGEILFDSIDKLKGEITKNRKTQAMFKPIDHLEGTKGFLSKKEVGELAASISNDPIKTWKRDASKTANT